MTCDAKVHGWVRPVATRQGTNVAGTNVAVGTARPTQARMERPSPVQ